MLVGAYAFIGFFLFSIIKAFEVDLNNEYKDTGYEDDYGNWR